MVSPGEKLEDLDIVIITNIYCGMIDIVALFFQNLYTLSIFLK